MNREADHKASLSKAKLQQSLHMAEVNLRKLLAIEIRGGETISTHDNTTRGIPRRSLVLVEDNDEGTVSAPAGTESEPVCRGEALIGGSEKKVALFRKVAVPAASPPAGPAPPSTPTPPATPAPPPPPPPPPAASGD